VRQRGIVHLVVIIVVLVLVAVVGGAVYFGKKVSPGGQGGFLQPFKGLSTLSNFTSGPGGCKGAQECEQFCQQNVEECIKWCDENPIICNLAMGGGQAGPPVDPPDTQITFAKSLNMIGDLVNEGDVRYAKELGANVVTLWYTVQFTNDNKINLFFAKGGFANLVNIAHKNGLQVELRASYALGTEATDLTEFRKNAKEYVTEVAKFAEKYRVYRIIPFGEIDNNLVNYPGQITPVAQELLAEMRKHYSGQIGTGVTAPWRDSGFTFAGYDYLSFSAYPQKQIGMDAWLTPKPNASRTNISAINLVLVTNWAREVADRSGISTLHLGETGVFDPEDNRSLTEFDTVIVSKEKEAEYYEKLFSQVSDKINGTSVFYLSKIKLMDVKGDPAEEVVKEWYGKL